jgi:hypothetical protein
MNLITNRAPKRRKHVGQGQRTDWTWLREPKSWPTGYLEAFDAVGAAANEDREIPR